MTSTEKKVENIIKNSKYEALADKFRDIAERPVDKYGRGIMHGFLLALTQLDVISQETALQVMGEQIDRENQRKYANANS